MYKKEYIEGESVNFRGFCPFEVELYVLWSYSWNVICVSSPLPLPGGPSVWPGGQLLGSHVLQVRSETSSQRVSSVEVFGDRFTGFPNHRQFSLSITVYLKWIGSL